MSIVDKSHNRIVTKAVDLEEQIDRNQLKNEEETAGVGTILNNLKIENDL